VRLFCEPYVRPVPGDQFENEWATMQSRRSPTDEEWRIAKTHHRRGIHVHGPVLSHHRFGFFVDLGETVNGLVELPFIVDPQPPNALQGSDDFPAAGTDIQAVVLDTVEDNRQFRLSMRPSDLARESWERDRAVE